MSFYFTTSLPSLTGEVIPCNGYILLVSHNWWDTGNIYPVQGIFFPCDRWCFLNFIISIQFSNIFSKEKKKKLLKAIFLLSVGLDPRLSFFIFYFFLATRSLERTKFSIYILFNTVFTLFQYCLRTINGTQSHFIKKNIKNGSHGIIHTSIYIY